MLSPIPPKVTEVISKIKDVGGAPYLVGGAVRDALLHHQHPLKDFDFEVYHLKIDSLIDTLSQFGTVETVGRSFGVIKLFMGNHLDLDFALPRRESKSGRGHRGFIVASDPDMSKEDACARRDYTINAMLLNPFSGEIIDFFNGRQDLEAGILRHTSSHFAEDPLRPLRGMQFAARFHLNIADETAQLCSELLKEAPSLAPERIYAEWEKWALFSDKPSIGLKCLVDMGWHHHFGPMAALPNQSTWTSTLEAVDRAASTAFAKRINRSERLVLLFSALCHTVSPDDGTQLMERIGVPRQYATKVITLLEHLSFVRRLESIDTPTILRRSVMLAPQTIRTLCRLLTCCYPSHPLEAALNADAESLGVMDRPLAPLLTGKHLIDHGIKPGKQMGIILDAAFRAQQDYHFSDIAGALQWLTRFLEQMDT